MAGSGASEKRRASETYCPCWSRFDSGASGVAIVCGISRVARLAAGDPGPQREKSPDRPLPYTPPGIRKRGPGRGSGGRPRHPGLERVRHSRWHGAASPARVSRSRAMSAGGRRPVLPVGARCRTPSSRSAVRGFAARRAPVAVGGRHRENWPPFCECVARWGMCRNVRHPGTGKYAGSPRCAGTAGLIRRCCPEPYSRRPRPG